MCLLIVLSRVDERTPLVVAANRDERYDRPATAMTVLEAGPPRVLGGRDHLAGGTWLAVNRAGVVAGLTNRPVEGGADPAKRSRGELPLRLARFPTADAAVEAFAAGIDATAYNPAWILVGDRRSLFSLDLSDGETLRVEALAPGLHVLENSPPGTASPKVAHVRSQLAGVEASPAAERSLRLAAVLSDHEVPAPARSVAAVGTPEAGEQVRANCVHTDRYGTRWSCLVEVPLGALAPQVRFAEGPPCSTPFLDAGALWTAEGHGAEAGGASLDAGIEGHHRTRRSRSRAGSSPILGHVRAARALRGPTRIDITAEGEDP